MGSKRQRDRKREKRKRTRRSIKPRRAELIGTLRWLAAVLGGAIGVIGLVGGGPHLFWLWITFLFVGLGVAVWEAWLSNWTTPVKIFATAAVASIVAVVWVTIVSANAPVAVTAMYNAGRVPAGAMVGDIAWRPEFGQLLVEFHNDSESDPYEDLRLELKPSSMVARIAHLGGCENVQTFDAMNISMQGQSRDSAGPQDVLPSALVGTDAGMVVTCRRLAAKNTLKLALAIVNVRFKERPGQTNFDQDALRKLHFADRGVTYFFGHENSTAYDAPPSVVSSLTASWQFVAGNRNRSGSVDCSYDFLLLLKCADNAQ